MSNQDPSQKKEIITLKAEVSQLQEQLRALELVVSWLLAHNPDSQSFLTQQATELEGNAKFVEDIAMLNELGEDVQQWHALWGK